MKNNYPQVVCLFISLNIAFFASAQPQFLNCSTEPVSLCVADPGVTIPLNNQIYLGVNHPDASSCSVHLYQTMRVKSNCGTTLQYEVQIMPFDTGTAISLFPLTTVTMDSTGEAELFYKTENSPTPLISVNGIPYTSGCNRYHRIRWIVTDSCGLSDSCDMLIDIYDCFKPNDSLEFQFFTLVMNCSQQGYIRLEEMIEAVSDDCSELAEIRYSLRPDFYKPDSSFNMCYSAGFGIEIPINIWVADSGRDLDCNGSIEWSERIIYPTQMIIVNTDNGCAPCEPINNDYHINGQIFTEDAQPVEKVEVTLSSLGHVFPTYVTSEDGKYSFDNIISPGVYEITPERNDNHKNGVSTLDLVKIQKHLLGKEEIENPYDLIAADANNSQNVSAIDLVELRKLILGVYTELPSFYGQSWRFVAADFVFADPTDPWAFDDSTEFVSIPPDQRVDFIAIKVGDVNNTVQPNAQSFEVRSARKSINFIVEQQDYRANDLIEIDFTIVNAQMIQGFQFTISSTELDFIDITSDIIGIGEENFASFGDKVTVSWFDEKGALLSQGDKIFTLTARSKSGGSLKQSLLLNSEITKAEVYTMNEELLEPKLMVLEREVTSTLYPPQPNPWKVQTNISFYLQSPGEVTFEIYDVSGRRVYTHAGIFDAGNNVIHIESDDFHSRGILLYSVKSGDLYLTNKMVVLE